MCIKRVTQAEMFLEITASIKEIKEAMHCQYSCQCHQWEPHWFWKGQDCNWMLLASFDGEWMSVRQSKAPSSSTVGHQKRWPMKVQPLVGSTTLTYHQATNRRVMHQCTQHGAMLHWLPYQGIVLTLLPFLPSPHKCIKRSASIWRGYDLLFLANLAYMARISSFSPGNTNGGPGLHDCQIRSCATFEACHAIVLSSVRKASFMSSPGRLDLFVKSLSSRSAGEYQPGPLATSWLCKSRHCGSRSPHMVLTSYFFLRSWKS